jgi:Uma2 family endonuclease
VSKEREDAIGRGDLIGSPEIVIEILSPSNRPHEMTDRAELFLDTGTKQFCEVDDTHRTVTVRQLGQTPLLYRAGDEVSFPLLGTSIKISEIWPA